LDRGGPEDLTLAWERFADVIDEALPLTRRHFEGLNLPYKFDPNWQDMLFAASQGRLGIVTARNARGHLVGYAMGAVTALIFAKDVRELCVNAIYIEPDYRGNLGNVRRLLDCMVDYGRKNNCVRLVMMPMGEYSRGIGRLLKHSGWVKSPYPIYEREIDGR
jgi:hypothetical protein